MNEVPLQIIIVILAQLSLTSSIMHRYFAYSFFCCHKFHTVSSGQDMQYRGVALCPQPAEAAYNHRNHSEILVIARHTRHFMPQM